MKPLPAQIELNYSKSIDLKYFVNHTRNNYTYPNVFDKTSHEIELNISFSDSGDWTVSIKYYMNVFENLYESGTLFVSRKFDYKFYNTSKLIYETNTNDKDMNYTDTHAFISSKTNINIGEIEKFRIEELIFLIDEDSQFDANLTYKVNDQRTLDNNNYGIRQFEGNRTELEYCSV